jgi:hypothetical protein
MVNEQRKDRKEIGVGEEEDEN